MSDLLVLLMAFGAWALMILLAWCINGPFERWRMRVFQRPTMLWKWEQWYIAQLEKPRHFGAPPPRRADP